MNYMNKLAFFKNKYLKSIAELLLMFGMAFFAITYGFVLLHHYANIELIPERLEEAKLTFSVGFWIMLSFVLVGTFVRYINSSKELTRRAIVSAVIRSLFVMSLFYWINAIHLFLTFGFFVAPVPFL